jgi:hypothetical protein
MVKYIAVFVFLLFILIILWCAHVTVIPDLNRMAVLSNGIWNGAIAIMPSGGQRLPISMLGARLLWKNAQKKLKKNSTSEVIKRIIPQRRPLTTQFV